MYVHFSIEKANNLISRNILKCLQTKYVMINMSPEHVRTSKSYKTCIFSLLYD